MRNYKNVTNSPKNRWKSWFFLKLQLFVKNSISEGAHRCMVLNIQQKYRDRNVWITLCNCIDFLATVYVCVCKWQAAYSEYVAFNEDRGWRRDVLCMHLFFLLFFSKFVYFGYLSWGFSCHFAIRFRRFYSSMFFISFFHY